MTNQEQEAFNKRYPINFINKRIWEQQLYIWDISHSSLGAHRKREIIDSAKGQLTYFEGLKWLSTEEPGIKINNPLKRKLFDE